MAYVFVLVSIQSRWSMLLINVSRRSFIIDITWNHKCTTTGYMKQLVSVGFWIFLNITPDFCQWSKKKTKTLNSKCNVNSNSNNFLYGFLSKQLLSLNRNLTLQKVTWCKKMIFGCKIGKHLKIIPIILNWFIRLNFA